MKRLFSAAMVIAAFGLAGCGGAAVPRDTAPADMTTDGGVTTEIAPTATASGGGPAPESQGGGRPKDPDPPGAPGSPIKYDHTLLQSTPKIAKGEIEDDIREVCGANLCDVKVLIDGSGECITSITLSPVKPGGTVTIKAVECKPDITTEPSTESPGSTSDQPTETTSG